MQSHHKQTTLLVLLTLCLLLKGVASKSVVSVSDQELCEHQDDCTGAPFATCQKGICAHKPIYPFLPSEIVGIVILPLLLGLANIGGIGGGGLIIPLAIGCWGFATPEAVSISNSTILFGAVLRFVGFSIHQKHPSADRTVIDYNLSSIMMPAVLLGAFSGLYLSAMLPEAVITIFLTLILFFLTYNTYKKTVNLCRKESRERLSYAELQGEKATAERQSPSQHSERSQRSKQSSSSKSYDSLGYQPLGSGVILGAALDGVTTSQVALAENSAKVQQLETREKTDLGQWRHHASSIFLIGMSFVIQLLRGSKNMPSIVGVKSCTVNDTLILSSFLLFNASIVFYEVRRVQKEQARKQMAGKALAEGEVELTCVNLATLIFGSVMGGLIGVMGLGGAVVFNPVLLSLGVQPTVVAATGMYLIMYSQASNTAIYILLGQLPLNYAVFIGAISCFGILLCMISLTRVIQRTGRQSIVVFVLALLLLASALMVPLFSVPQLMTKMAQGANIWAFNNPCQ